MTRIDPRCMGAALTGVFCVLLAFASPSADAASYTVWSCRGPDGAAISTAAWETINEGPATSDGCASGGSLTTRLLQSDDLLPSRPRGYRFALPPGARVSGYRIYLYAQTANAAVTSNFQAGIDAAEPIGVIDAGCPAATCTFGTQDPPLDAANLIAADGIDLDWLNVGTICNKPLGCYVMGGDNTLAQARMYRAEVDVRDDDVPVLLDPSGLPAEGQTVSANSLVSFDASDNGGGVATLALLVDGNEVAHQDAGGACQQPFARAAPCPAQLTAALPLTVSSLSPGSHTASVRAVDAAGNVTTGPPVTFTAAPPPVTVVERLVQAPLAAEPLPVTIRAARGRIALPAKGGSIAGVVQDTAGNLLAGVKVFVRSRPFGVRRAKLRLERMVTTDAFGRFESPAGGASRLVILDVSDATHRALEPVELSLMQRLKVGIVTRDPSLRNGTTLTVRASVNGAGSGAGGKVVLVQAFVEGRWTTVDSLNAGADGRALWRYRFRSTTRRTGYRFRLKVERAGDIWPWPTTTSRSLRVEVSP